MCEYDRTHRSPPHDLAAHGHPNTHTHNPYISVELAQAARRLYGELLPAFESLFSRRKNAKFLEVIRTQ